MRTAHDRHSEQMWRRQHCEGDCHQGRQPCQEMACWTDDDEMQAGQSWLIVLAIGAIAVASFLAWLSPLFD